MKSEESIVSNLEIQLFDELTHFEAIEIYGGLNHSVKIFEGGILCLSLLCMGAFWYKSFTQKPALHGSIEKMENTGLSQLAKVKPYPGTNIFSVKTSLTKTYYLEDEHGEKPEILSYPVKGRPWFWFLRRKKWKGEFGEVWQRRGQEVCTKIHKPIIVTNRPLADLETDLKEDEFQKLLLNLKMHKVDGKDLNSFFCVRVKLSKNKSVQPYHGTARGPLSLHDMANDFEKLDFNYTSYGKMLFEEDFHSFKGFALRIIKEINCLRQAFEKLNLPADEGGMGIKHNDLHPKNVLWNFKSKNFVAIDFDSAKHNQGIDGDNESFNKNTRKLLYPLIIKNGSYDLDMLSCINNELDQLGFSEESHPNYIPHRFLY